MPSDHVPPSDRPNAAPPPNAPGGDLARDPWVFAYGSLMWNPGFPFAERCEARLIGAHRALCVYSFHHRGTPEHPGLVLGLDLGGACRGIAYRVAASDWPQVDAYLTAREQISGVYRECTRRIRLLDGSRRDEPALAYLVNRAHPQYARGLGLEEQLALVRRSHGKSGPNADYVVATVAALEALGLADPGLTWIAHQLRPRHGA
ncbi:gamma-glutamylcyclotransferase [Xanthobacter sp. KR7-225]|uniref:gamma-glutamylcyclotransferase n=1 Tax=Xanthobacter sp. KR7-225 TaxID=3156613 RepID=UPI0032B5B666